MGYGVASGQSHCVPVAGVAIVIGGRQRPGRLDVRFLIALVAQLLLRVFRDEPVLELFCEAGS